jgi:type IV pilus assembly protein PilQ
MKRSLPLYAWPLSIFLLVAALFGCAAKVAPEAESGPPLVRIQEIAPREADGKTEITIGGEAPFLQYTSFQLTEPLRLVVDIPDADIGEFQDRINVFKGPIVDITPSQLDNVARLEIGLSGTVESKVYQDAGKLMVEFGKAAKVAEAPKPTAPVEEKMPEPEPPASGTAKTVTGVKATAGRDGVRVVISADGIMKPNTFMLEGSRLVIDIPEAKSRVRPSVIPVRKGGVARVRVGQHSKPERKVRVVLDLTGPMEYTATPDGNTLIVVLTQAAAERAAPAQRAPAREKETVDAPKPKPLPPQMEEPQVPEDLTLITAGKYSGRRISLDLQDADLVNVIRLFAEVANLNMIVSPEVRGKVTVRMVNIPWDQAMDIILKMNGLGYIREDNILRIASMQALAKESEDESRAKEAKKKAEDLVTRIIPVNYSSAAEIDGAIKKSLTARGETTVDVRTNTLIVRDIPRNVDEVVQLVKILDKPIPQVMIEARIVEANTNFTREIGVQWGGKFTADASTGNPTGLAFPNSIGVTGGPSMGTTPSSSGNYFVNLPAAAGIGGGGSVGFTFGSLSKALNLDLILSAAESTGEGKVISTPRISALDNKEAVIQQGQSIPYTTSSASGTSVQFIDANLLLAVTPHVTPDNKIFMKIKASKNSPDTSLLGAGGQPSIRKNEASTEILLSDGETAVIGGILIIDRGQTIQRVPFLADLPLIGWLFKKKTVKNDKRELLIFITPRIVKQEPI